MENYDAALRSHVGRSLGCFGVIALRLVWSNKRNMSGFSYLSADSGVVSSAAVAHRVDTASPRSAAAGRSGALRSGAGTGCPEMQPVCSQQLHSIWSHVNKKRCKYKTVFILHLLQVL